MAPGSGPLKTGHDRILPLVEAHGKRQDLPVRHEEWRPDPHEAVLIELSPPSRSRDQLPGLSIVGTSRPTASASRSETLRSWIPDAHIRVAGNPEADEVLIATNGGPGVTSDYMLDLETLAGPELRVVTYDQRGNGRSTGPAVVPANYTLEAYASDIEAIRRELGVERVHLFGHSYGGLITMQYASDFPSRTASMIFFGSGPPRFDQMAQADSKGIERVKELIAQGVIEADFADLLGTGEFPQQAYFSDPAFQFPEDGPGGPRHSPPTSETLRGP